MAKTPKSKPSSSDAYTDANFVMLPNLEAIEAFNSKMTGISYSYLDVLAHEHAVAFTVAKMMDEDLLSETKQAISNALENGTDFREFQKQLKPHLMKNGWWGEDVMTDPADRQRKKVQLGSTRRLRTIYHTNLHSAYAAGQWERIEQTKDLLPYLEYMPSVAQRKRKDHKQYYGWIKPVDDPIWQYIMPPNGYGCLCWVKQLTRKQAEAKGITDDKDIEFEQYENPRTGQKIDVPVGITPSFAHNAGDRLGALRMIAEDKHGSVFAGQIMAETTKILARYDKPALAAVALPAATQWADASVMGREIWEKHSELFDAVDLDQEHAFANAMLEVMTREGVEIGAKAKVAGDGVGHMQDILERYPASWVNAANEAGTTYVRMLDSRGFQAFLTDQNAKYLNTVKALPAQYKPFAKFAPNFQAGDSLIRTGKISAKDISPKQFDTAIHEYGHRLQAVMPELDEYFKQLFISRTKGEKTRPLVLIQQERGEMPYYNLKETGRKDNFVNVYFGRNYGDDINPKPLELLTMTMQTVLGSGQSSSVTIKKLLKEDSEMVYLAIALLIRYKP